MPSDPHQPPDRPAFGPVHSRILLGMLVIGYAWLFPWSEQINNPNEMVRVYMSRAIVETGSYAIGRREVAADGQVRDRGLVYEQWGYVNDKAMTCDDAKAERPACNGLLYAGKAPGLSQLGAMPLWVQIKTWALLGLGAPSKAAIVWWLRLWLAVLPSIAGLYWLALYLPRRLQRPQLGWSAVLAAAFGSLSLTYGQMFAGHQLSGLALLLGFAAVQRAGPVGGSGWLALAGFGIAAAPWIEFPAGPAAIVLLAWTLLRRHQVRDLACLAAGGAIPVLLLAHFNWRAFGAPWKLPYGFLENPDFVRDIAPGVFGLHLPNAEKLIGSLVSPFTGLYFWAPWVALAWLGLIGVRRSRGELSPAGSQPEFWFSRRAEALLAWAVVAYFVFFQCSHSLWRGGWVLGPRYITALVPFAAIAVAHGIDALRGWPSRIAQAALAVSTAVAIAVTGVGTAVSQGFPFEVYNPLREVVGPLLSHGWVWSSPLYWVGVPIGLAAGPWFATLATAILWQVWVLSASDLPQSGLSRRLAKSAAMLLVAALWVAGLWSIPPRRSPASLAETISFLSQTWWPAAPKGARPLAPPPASAAPK